MKKDKTTDAIENMDLFDANGKLVEKYGPNYSKVVLDISKHPAGIYFLKVTINKKDYTHKFITEVYK